MAVYSRRILTRTLHQPFRSTFSTLSSAPRIKPDAIFALTAEFNQDSSPKKVNLGQGTYRDDKGQPWVLPSVIAARNGLLDQGLNHEYLPILGLPDFRKATCELVLGRPSERLKAKQVSQEGES